jgi:YdjC-like protein
MSEDVSRAGTTAAGIGTRQDSSAQLLGFPADARVLILNCDDLGMHESINAAVLAALQQGVASSTSLTTFGLAESRAAVSSASS